MTVSRRAFFRGGPLDGRAPELPAWATSWPEEIVYGGRSPGDYGGRYRRHMAGGPRSPAVYRWTSGGRERPLALAGPDLSVEALVERLGHAVVEHSTDGPDDVLTLTSAPGSPWQIEVRRPGDNRPVKGRRGPPGPSRAEVWQRYRKAVARFRGRRPTIAEFLPLIGLRSRSQFRVWRARYGLPWPPPEG